MAQSGIQCGAPDGGASRYTTPAMTWISPPTAPTATY